MSDHVVRACEELLQIADQGHAWTRDTLFGSDPKGADIGDDEFVGFGYKLTGAVPVLGSDDGGTCFLYVVTLDNPRRLYLETKLEWTRRGARYASSARYILSPATFHSLQAMADELARQPRWRRALSLNLLNQEVREPESSRFVAEVEQHGVQFIQAYPGCDSGDASSEEREAIQEAEGCHAKAVLLATARYPFLGMLSVDEYGFVLPTVLPHLLEWVEAQLFAMS